MNQFKGLDAHFPCGAERMFGEVVSITVRMKFRGSDESQCFLSFKRKAWYVNASINAFHLHRELCRQAREGLHGVVPDRRIRGVKKDLACMVWWSYLENSRSGKQYYNYEISLGFADSDIVVLGEAASV